MEFRLVYRGPLPPEKLSKAGDKHFIRKQFHPQLREYWTRQFQLRGMLEQSPQGRSRADDLADEYTMRTGFRFLPLVNQQFRYTCSLDILFLRRDVPGNLFDHFGDIDNRLKTLIDGLKMPKKKEECGGYVPDADEDPFYCLLEDDILVTDFSVTTDTILIPQQSDEAVRDVLAVIHVQTKSFAI